MTAEPTQPTEAAERVRAPGEVDALALAGQPHVRRRAGASLVVGSILVAMVVLMALVSFVWTPHDPTLVNAEARLRDVGDPAYWLGTDKFGRDVFSQILVGARTTLFVGVVAVGVAGLIGVPLGIVSAMATGWLGETLMRAMDLLLAFPALLLAIMFSAIYGGSTLVAMIAIGIATIPIFARIVRSGALQVLRTEYILAPAPRPQPWAIGLRHVLPNEQPGHRAGVGRLRDRRPRRGRPVLPRLRDPTPDAELGPDAPGEPGAALLRAAARLHPGCRHRPGRPRFQPAGRWTA